VFCVDLRTNSDYYPKQHQLSSLYKRDLTLHRLVVTICTTSLTFNNSTFRPHRVFMCFVWILEQISNTSIHNVNCRVFITLYSLVVNICTTKLTFKNSTLCPQSVFLSCVDLRTKQPLFPYTTLTHLFYNRVWTLYSPVVTICTTSLIYNNSTFCPHSLYVSCVDLRKSSDYFPIQH